MLLCNCLDNFQESMNKLFNNIDYVRAYITYLLIISNKSLEDHIKRLDKVTNKSKTIDFKVNVENSSLPKINQNT